MHISLSRHIAVSRSAGDKKWHFAELCYHTAFDGAVATLVSLAPHMSVIPPFCCDRFYEIEMYEIKGNFLHTVLL